MRQPAPLHLVTDWQPLLLTVDHGFMGICPDHIAQAFEGGITEVKTPTMRRQVLAAKGLRKIIIGALDHLTSNIAPALRGDAEGIHQMRIALRSLRAALELFEPWLDPAAAGRFDTELKDLGRLCGTARDWDVFCLQTLPAAIADLRLEPLTELRHAAEAERRLAHATVVNTLRGRHFADLILSLVAWIEDVEAKRSIPGNQRLAVLAPSLLDRIARKVEKRDHRAGKLSAKARHGLRKALDNLCDDTKSLTSLFPRRQLARYQGKCENLQAILGLANDADVARRLALSLMNDRPIPPLLRWIKRRSRKSLKGFEAARDAFRAAPAFWQ